MPVKISTEKPPMLDLVEKYFKVDLSRTAFAYGDTIYKQDGVVLDDLLAHEEIHLTQQSKMVGGAAAWWERYMVDIDFRLEQEIPAYQAQYKWFRRRITNKDHLKRIRNIMAEDMSGPTYGHMIGRDEAFRIIAR